MPKIVTLYKATQDMRNRKRDAGEKAFKAARAKRQGLCALVWCTDRFSAELELSVATGVLSEVSAVYFGLEQRTARCTPTGIHISHFSARPPIP